MADSPRPSHEGSQPASVEPLKFVYDLPPISERQLAIVKLVARYVACDASFARAGEFDFTSRGHGLNPLFQAFVDQYKLVLDGARPNTSSVLERAVARARHESQEPLALQAAQTGAEPHARTHARTQTQDGLADKAAPAPGAFAAIDWQDFVVLETVEFFSADLKGASRLSAPITRAEAALHREQTSRKRPTREPLYKSPYTGEAVAASQFDEHMRVMAMDPAWQKQKQAAAERQATTNLDTASAAENLARLQEKRRRLLEE